jgi:hypothetical protein
MAEDTRGYEERRLDTAEEVEATAGKYAIDLARIFPPSCFTKWLQNSKFEIFKISTLDVH